MIGYSIRLEPHSPWASPWHADTLFASLAWAWRDMAGEEELLRLLAQFESSQPPFVLSDVFPGDLLPFPVAAEAAKAADEKRKALWITRSTFERFALGSAEPLEVAIEGGAPVRTLTRLHASLGRITDSTEDGQLFEIDAQALTADLKQEHLTLYFRCQDESLADLLTALEIVSTRGFGKKASSGMGAFSVCEKPAPCGFLNASQGVNGFYALSHFIPASTDPSDGAWKLHVKYPKFQSNRVRHFLKGRFLLLQPGSVFRATERREWCGCTVNLGNDEMPRALQYGLGLAAPVALPTNWRSHGV